MTYAAALDYLYYALPMFQRTGPKAFKKDLTNIKALLLALGNPEREFKSIHIAGTNGKGTSAHMLSALMQSNGLNIGLYTSPHYRDFRERIKINGQYIDKKYVSRFVDKIKSLTKAQNLEASFFEITVAMAFQFFADQKVDFAVIETGLGGRLDSTNVLNPEICLITNISLDHTQFLGNTPKAIAKEKAGIIKKNVPVVIGEYQKEVASVFANKAKREQAEICFASRKRIPKIKGIPKEPLFFYKNRRSALVTYLELSKQYRYLKTSKGFMQKALDNYQALSTYIGRWQILNDTPLCVADSAHNEGGLSILMDHVRQLKFDQLHIVFGMVSDKSGNRVMDLLPKTAKYYFVAADIPRAKAVNVLQEEAKDYGMIGHTYRSVRSGFSAAKRTAKESDLVLVLGSIFVVAEVISYVK